MSLSGVETRLPVDHPAPKMPRARVWMIVLLLTAAAAAFRLYKLGEWSFWVDEMFTLMDSLDPQRLYHGMTYPLSYILIGWSMTALGVNEWSARIVPAIFGIITPAMVYLLGRRSFGDAPSAIAAGLLAISPWHLYWSQMARFYTMTLFFSSAAILLVHRGLEVNKKSYMAGAGVLMVMSALSHYSGLLSLVAVGAYAVGVRLLRWPKPQGANLSNWLILFAPFILTALVLGSRAGALFSTYAAGQPTGTSFSNPLVGGAYMVVSISYRIGPALVLLALVGLWLGICRRERGALLLTSAAIVPVVLLVVVGMMSHAENRYAFVVLVPALLLAGSAISEAAGLMMKTNRALAFVIPIAIALPLMQHNASYFSSVSNGERWNYRAAAEFLRSNAQRGDMVYSSMPIPLDYYLKKTGLTVRDLDIGKDITDLPNKPAWLVMEDATRGESASRALARWLETDCNLVAHFPASSPVANYGLSVYYWDGY
ncbi:MAG: glycosyltransferase family 39 protein [Armatimonadetes bacterium]|nr:glycosyltransferase family 39 protein [Armatimonadota bacterium]